MEQEARKICVRDIMSKAVLSIDADSSVLDAAKMLEDAEVGAIIVMQNNVPVGIVTDRDLAIRVVAQSKALDTPVKMIMSSPLYSVTSDEPVRAVADFMQSRGVRKIPVFYNGKVVGIVTATDLVRQLALCTADEIRKMYYQSLVKIYDHMTPYT